MNIEVRHLRYFVAVAQERASPPRHAGYTSPSRRDDWLMSSRPPGDQPVIGAIARTIEQWREHAVAGRGSACAQCRPSGSTRGPDWPSYQPRHSRPARADRDALQVTAPDTPRPASSGTRERRAPRCQAPILGNRAPDTPTLAADPLTARDCSGRLRCRPCQFYWLGRGTARQFSCHSLSASAAATPAVLLTAGNRGVRFLAAGPRADGQEPARRLRRYRVDGAGDDSTWSRGTHSSQRGRYQLR